MKAWIFSDLHLEIDPAFPWLNIPDADICICAGDVLEGGVRPSIEWMAKNIVPHMPVVFVAGNHEYHHASIDESISSGYAALEKYDGFYFLEGDSVVFGKFMFVGATLWTDFLLLGHVPSALAAAKERLNDFRCIKLRKTPFKRFSPREAMHLHYQSRLDLELTMAEAGDLNVIVVTHHAPSLMSVPRHLLKDSLTPSFASSLESKILEYEPLLWVHGHVHRPSAYYIGKTRIACNPLGYPGEPSRNFFNPNLVIDLEDLVRRQKS